MSIDIIARALAASKAGLVNGKVPAEYLPSYVDEAVDAYVIEGATEFSSGWLSLTSGGSALTPDASKIYNIVSQGDFNHWTFRWTGSTYAVVYAVTPEGVFVTSEQLAAALTTKQDVLTSGTNIKTINGESVLGAGDLQINASISVDTSMSDTSTNAVQNKTIKEYVDSQITVLNDEKQNSTDDSLLTTNKTIVGSINELNTLKYEKPTNGIPSDDLSSEVQESLTKANTAIQEIKTINNQSLIGQGNIDISSGSANIPIITLQGNAADGSLSINETDYNTLISSNISIIKFIFSIDSYINSEYLAYYEGKNNLDNSLLYHVFIYASPIVACNLIIKIKSDKTIVLESSNVVDDLDIDTVANRLYLLNKAGGFNKVGKGVLFKTLNNESLLGGGDITIKTSPIITINKVIEAASYNPDNIQFTGDELNIITTNPFCAIKLQAQFEADRVGLVENSPVFVLSAVDCAGTSYHTYYKFISVFSTGSSSSKIESLMLIVDGTTGVGQCKPIELSGNNSRLTQVTYDASANIIYSLDTGDVTPSTIPFKTINNQSILGEGNINIGSGSVGLPDLPDDASTKTYILKAVNGNIQWVEEQITLTEVQ